MLMQLSNSFLVATRLDAWEHRNRPGKKWVPEHLREDVALTRTDTASNIRPNRKETL